uniref:RRM domain-containing protein n=1 Tax=Meloidogyne enterolobii TaxID=390850 RepID=A0A6V7UG93_MELEN|nr:unnamed protein product [Meloidogyne enterolobii]
MDNSQQSTENNETVTKSQTNRIFIGNLASELEEFTIYKYCSAYGEIVKCQIMKEPKTDKSRGFGFITYAQTSSSEAILDARPHYIGHHKINVRPAFPTSELLSQNIPNTPSSNLTTRRLFIAYNKDEAKRNNLLEPAIFGYLSTFGVVKEIVQQFSSSSSQLPSILNSPQPLNDYWIVEFLDEESVEKCMKIGALHYFSGVRFYVKRVISEQDILRRKRKLQQMEEAINNHNNDVVSSSYSQQDYFQPSYGRKIYAASNTYGDTSMQYSQYGSSPVPTPPPPPSQQHITTTKSATTLLSSYSSKPIGGGDGASRRSVSSAEEMLKGYGYH